jgi:hypothetical protein
MYYDQHGCIYWAKSRKELKEKVGSGHVSIMYRDKKDGSTVQIGYVIGKHWLQAFEKTEKKVER